MTKRNRPITVRADGPAAPAPSDEPDKHRVASGLRRADPGYAEGFAEARAAAAAQAGRRDLLADPHGRRMSCWLAAVFAAFVAASPAPAYLADAVTGPALNLVGTNLFVSATSSNPAPVGRALWFVADVSLNGVPLAPQAGAVLGPDDVLLHQDAADGMILGNAPGQYKRTGVEVADVYANANIFVYLWSVDTNAAPGSAGQTFDVLNLGVLAPPEVGNAAWLITTPLFSDRYLVLDAALLSAPEPSLLWLVAAGLAVIGVAKRATAGY